MLKDKKVVSSEYLGTASISKLLLQQSVPASIGILVMSINVLVDTIFMGRWIGVYATGAVQIVLPISFLIATVGMSIGVGGASMISRALGAGLYHKAYHVFGNQIVLNMLITIGLVTLGLIYTDKLLLLFGAHGILLTYAKDYYQIIMLGVPMLAFSMMGNTVIRAEGKASYAMFAMIIPTLMNLLMDYICIQYYHLGISGAAWATFISYMASFLFVTYFFCSKKTQLSLYSKYFLLDKDICLEILALGGITFVRQAMLSLMYWFMNNLLYDLGKEALVSVYAIISRMTMFSLFAIFGVTQGFLPIASYNYGKQDYNRLSQVIIRSLYSAVIVAIIVVICIFCFSSQFTKLFISSQEIANNESHIQYIIRNTPQAMFWYFLTAPLISFPLIVSAYYQAIGKVIPALCLTLLRQGVLLLPIVYCLSKYYGILGVWISFTISDILSALVSFLYLKSILRELKTFSCN